MKKIIILLYLISFNLIGQKLEKAYFKDLSNYVLNKSKKGWKATTVMKNNKSYLKELDKECSCRTGEKAILQIVMGFFYDVSANYWHDVFLDMTKFKSLKDAKNAYENYKVIAKRLYKWDKNNCRDSDRFHHEFWLVEDCLITATGARITENEYNKKIKLVDEYIKKHPTMKVLSH